MTESSERFCPALEAIRAAGITSAEGLLSVLPPRNPLDWLSLVILLDQIPRNCYRGPAAGVAFSVFDPLARGVALAAMDIGIPHAQPEVRWAFARRFWFYLPLMHSEDMAVHERAVAEYGRMVADIDALVAASQQGAAEVPAEQREVVRVIGADVEGAKTMAKLQMEFEMKHYDIIKQFGRYPHRNAALGRETTAEEKEYLENGGETFGG